ncbi:MAG: hypothetical protein ACR2NP_09590 [Pirellulaceae bacterium]
MVLVQPPEGWEPPAGEALPPLPRRPRDPKDPNATLTSEFDDLEGVLAGEPTTSSASQERLPVRTSQSRGANAPQSTAAPAIADDGPVMPDARWTSDSAQQRGKAVAWTAGIIGVSLLALVLTAWLITQMIGSGGAEESPEQVAQLDADDTGTTADSGTEPDVDAPLEPDVPDGPGNAKGEEPTNPGMADPGADKPADVVDPEGPGVPPEDDNSGQPEEPAIDVEAALNNGQPMEVTAEGQEESMVDSMGEMRDLLFEPGVNTTDLRDMATDPQDNLIGIGKVYVPRPDALDLDPLASLDMQFPGIAWTDIPLLQFIRNFNRLTRIPIQLDTNSVIGRQIDPHATITITVENGSAGQVLQAALDTLGLVWQWNDTNDVIIVLPAGYDELTSHEFPVDSILVADEKQADEIEELVKRVVQPDSWNTAGGEATITISDGKCVVEQTGPTARQVESLLGRLTAAAKIKADPTAVEPREQLATIYSRNDPVRTSISAYEDIQLDVVSRVLDQVQRHDGLTILVNWHELMPYGWNPSTQIPWKSRDQKIEKTLLDLTSSMGVAWRMLDESTLEVTSSGQMWNASRLEIYPCGRQQARNHKPEQIIRFLQNGIAADLPQASWTRVEFVPRLDCIVALLPDPLHIRAERILDQLAEE